MRGRARRSPHCFRAKRKSQGRRSGFWREGHGPAPDASGVKERVTDGRGYGHDGSFAGARGRNVFAIEKDRFDHRKVAETWDAIVCKERIFDAAVFELNGFEQSAAESLDVGTDDLIAQTVGIDDGAAFECGDETEYLEFG